MNTRLLQKVALSPASLILSLMLVAVPALGQTGQPKQKPLEDKENPLLIGKRNINKGQIDFYSLDKEVALGRQLAAEVDRSSKFVTDPLVNEYVNRVGQNLVLHSDAKVPFTIKVVDDSVVNAFAQNDRPMLKRRPASTGNGDDSEQQPPERPTLKRGDSAPLEDSSNQGLEAPERPTLKRDPDREQ